MKGIFGLMFFIISIPSFGAEMSHAEAVVRTAYAKLAFATKINFIEHVKSEKGLTSSALNERLAKEGLQFELKDFTSGDIKDIAARSYADLVTKPNGESVLSSSLVTPTFKNNVTGEQISETIASARWQQGQDLTFQDWNLPVSTVLRIIENGNWYSRYAAYTVTVSFQGRSRTYKAMFLFGKDDKGQDVELAADNVTDKSPLMVFARTSVYPNILLHTTFRANPLVSDWLKSVQDQSCKSGEVCCDPATLSCSISADDVRSTEPIEPIWPTTDLRPVIQQSSGIPRDLWGPLGVH